MAIPIIRGQFESGVIVFHRRMIAINLLQILQQPIVEPTKSLVQPILIIKKNDQNSIPVIDC